ncbi:MAG: accessory factor UbiK family protein [Micavibrio sp.]
MKPDPKLFDDLSRVAGGALNVFSAFREQIAGDIRARVDEAASRMDLVPREDFERLEARVNELQKQLDALGGDGGGAKGPKKAAAKSAAKTQDKPKAKEAAKTAAKTQKKPAGKTGKKK